MRSREEMEEVVEEGKKWKRWGNSSGIYAHEKRARDEDHNAKSGWENRIGESEKCPPVSPE